MIVPHPFLVLASQSKARYHMLRTAGLNFAVQDPDINEAVMQARMKDTQVPADVMAQALAQAKALSISSTTQDTLVIGADQVLFCDGRFFSKATTIEEAIANFKFLNGKTHHLVSGVCLAQKDKILWHHTDRARLTMRSMSDAEIEKYCGRAGDSILRCVGGYELEGLGAWLFDQIEGDYFTILGMPLLPLLQALRGQGYGL